MKINDSNQHMNEMKMLFGFCWMWRDREKKSEAKLIQLCSMFDVVEVYL